MVNNVTFVLPKREIENADIAILVKQDNAVLGKLLISKGGIVWRGKNQSKRGKRFGWTKFAALMAQQPEPKPKSKPKE